VQATIKGIAMAASLNIVGSIPHKESKKFDRRLGGFLLSVSSNALVKES
jgi:hypothetical protein